MLSLNLLIPTVMQFNLAQLALAVAVATATGSGATSIVERNVCFQNHSVWAYNILTDDIRQTCSSHKPGQIPIVVALN